MSFIPEFCEKILGCIACPRVVSFSISIYPMKFVA